MARRVYTCGVPAEHCKGTETNTSAMMYARDKVRKVHGSRVQAFSCMRRYLVDVLGAEQLGPREFRMPEGGIRVLTKKSRYGAELREGKYSTRVMPGQEHTGGVIGSH